MCQDYHLICGKPVVRNVKHNKRAKRNLTIARTMRAWNTMGTAKPTVFSNDLRISLRHLLIKIWRRNFVRSDFFLYKCYSRNSYDKNIRKLGVYFIVTYDNEIGREGFS